jgi:uncharacterized membrane protein
MREPTTQRVLPPGEVPAEASRNEKCKGPTRAERVDEILSSALLWLLMGLFVIVALRTNFDRYERFGMRYDLAVFDQGTWLISRGYSPFVTVRGTALLADHFSAILYLVAPLYRLWASPKLLLAIQAIAAGLGALPVYKIVQVKTGLPHIALLCAVAYLAYPAVQYVAVDEFHPEAVSVALLLSALYCLQVRRVGLMTAMLAAACLTKETTGLTVIVFGLYALSVDRRSGTLAILTGAMAMAIAFGTMRYCNHGQPSGYIVLYNRFGDTPVAIVRYLLGHPGVLASQLFGHSMRRYLFDLLAPVMFLSLLAPDVLSIAIPALLTNALSSRPYMRNLGGHFTVLITPFVFCAAIVGMERFLRRGNTIANRGLFFCFIVCLLLTIVRGPFFVDAGTPDHLFSGSSCREIREMLTRIPPDASISAETQLLAFVSHRREVYLFPNPVFVSQYGPSAQAQLQMDHGDKRSCSPALFQARLVQSGTDYIALCATPTTVSHLSRSCSIEALESPAYGVIATTRHAILLRRGAAHRDGLRMLATRCGCAVADKAGIGRAYDAWVALQFSD